MVDGIDVFKFDSDRIHVLKTNNEVQYNILLIFMLKGKIEHKNLDYGIFLGWTPTLGLS